MKLQQKFKQLQEERSGILATNFYNYETLQGVLKAAQVTNSPIILQLTQSSIDYMGLEMAVKMGRQGLNDYGVEGWIHLDHGGSVDLAKQCLDSGFDSVMIDASEEAFEVNIDRTAQVVKYAESYNANVEAELGFIAKLGQEKDDDGFTTPEQAKAFVDATGINALAIAIGSAHGFYKAEPKLDMERLTAIREAVDVALVLHGSSGIPSEQIREAVKRGIVKINLATEIKNIFMQTLKGVMATKEEIDLRKVFPEATNEIKDLVSAKLELVKNPLYKTAV